MAHPLPGGAASVRDPTPEEGSCPSCSSMPPAASLTRHAPGLPSGRPPRNKGIRYPPTHRPSRRSSAVMRTAGESVHGRRLRGLVVVFARAGCGSPRGSVSLKATSTGAAGRCSSATARAASGARSGWTARDGNSFALARGARRDAGRSAVLRRQRPTAGGRGRPAARARAAAARSRGQSAATLRASSAATRPCRRDGPGGRAADRDPAAARARRSRCHVGLLQGIDNAEVVSTVHSRRAPYDAGQQLLLSVLLLLDHFGCSCSRNATARNGASGVSVWASARRPRQASATAAHSLPLSDPLQALGGRRRCQSSVMTTLPLARPCSTYASASRVWSNGNVLSMSGRRWPAS